MRFYCKSTAAALMAAISLAGAADAQADVLYSNGPIDGTQTSWSLNFGYTIADSFSLASSSVVTGAELGIWASDETTHLLTISWAIWEALPGGVAPLFAGVADVSNTFQFNNGIGYDIYRSSFDLPNLALPAGTYWLQLYDFTTDFAAGHIGWDINGGMSMVSHGLFGDRTLCDIHTSGRCSSSFDILGMSDFGLVNPGNGSPVPEPNTLSLIGAGLLGAGVLRRRRKAAQA